MGNNESRSMEVLKYFDKEWEYLRTNKQGIKIYRNRDSDQEVEAHTVSIEAKTNLLKQYDIYNYRRMQDTALVKTYAVQNLKDTSPNLCGNRDILKVMIESMPVRATDLHNLTLQESLYLLSECLRGFDDCYSKVGLFQIKDAMVGLNSGGHVKVWLNENYAQNHPIHQRPLLQTTISNDHRQKSQQEEYLMLTQVIQLVDKKCENNLPESLYNKLKNQSCFADAYGCVEDYCKIKQIDIPDRITFFQSGDQEYNFTRQMQSKVDKPFQVLLQKDDFSFKNYNIKKDNSQQANNNIKIIKNSGIEPGRQTLINRLPRDTLVSKYQKDSRVQQSKPTPPPAFVNTQGPTVYTYCTPFSNHTLNNQRMETNRTTYEPEPKISLKAHQSTKVGQFGSSAQYNNINFNYSPNRQTVPPRSNFVTSDRF